MNARDQVKPKSIRLAILMALADGGIITIDDLLIKVDEPRNKLVNNAQAAHQEGLIKRMRDDVTGLAAYQITPAGKKYLEKYADGSKAEPVAEPVVRENQTTEVPTCQESRQVAQATKKAEAVAVKVLEEAMPGFTAEVIAQKDAEISSLSRRLRDAITEIETLNKEQIKVADRSKAILEQNDALTDQLADTTERLARIDLMVRNSCAEAVTADATTEILLAEILHEKTQRKEPAGYVIQRPAKPLMRITKAVRAQERALAFARGGKRAQVFALVAIGTAVPGAEWKE